LLIEATALHVAHQRQRTADRIRLRIPEHLWGTAVGKGGGIGVRKGGGVGVRNGGVP
jgi:hypothetical protein